jgi:hypothetical protein
MDIFTVDRDYKTAQLVQEFESVIWTERYYGDSEVELVVPMRRETLEKLPLGILIGSSKSDELMILEEGRIEEGSMKYTGIGVLPWLNNRFVRYSQLHRDKSTQSGVMSDPGSPMWNMIWYGASDSSPSLTLDDGSYGIPAGYGHRMMIPGLGLRSIDAVPTLPESEWFTFTIDFEPLYDAVRKLAETHQVGIKIDWQPNQTPILGFRAYRGVDRTSQQTDYPIVRFSPALDSLTDIKELLSKTNYKNLAFTYNTNAPLDYTTPGIAFTEEASESSGFDLRVAQAFVDDIADVPYDYDVMIKFLNGDARKHLGENRFVRVIDGQVIPGPHLVYGRDYGLGDLVEEQGNTGAVSVGRITEFIRAQDANGYREFPTISEIETINTNIVSP